MSKSMRDGCIILALAPIMVGCATPPENKKADELVAVYTKMAEVLAKVTDKASFDTHLPEYQSLVHEWTKINTELDGFGVEKKKAALDSVKTRLEEAENRHKTEKERMRKILSAAR